MTSLLYSNAAPELATLLLFSMHRSFRAFYKPSWAAVWDPKGGTNRIHEELQHFIVTGRLLDWELPEHIEPVLGLSIQIQNDCCCNHGTFLVTYLQRWSSIPFVLMHMTQHTRLKHTEDTCKVHMHTHMIYVYAYSSKIDFGGEKLSFSKRR